MRGLGTPLTSLPENEDGEWHEEEEEGTTKKLVEDDNLKNDAPLPLKTITDDDEDDTKITGVLVGRSVRAYHASLDLIVLEDDDDNYHVLVRIQFQGEAQALRSYMRRYCKNGDLLHIPRGVYQEVGGVETEWQQASFVVDVASVQDAGQVLQVKQVRYWGLSKWQAWQAKLYRQQQSSKKNNNNKKKQNASENNRQAHHSGGLEKRQQGEYLAIFLLNMILAKEEITDKTSRQDPSTWANVTPNNNNTAALDYLNGGSGVLDVAGGSGHVSMALGMLSIHSTVVDPREAVGKLPGRDRKIWNRALKGKKQKVPQREIAQQLALGDVSLTTSHDQKPPPLPTELICQPAVQVRPFETFRAWFGTPPPGIDQDYRNTDQATNIPICDENHPLVQQARAIVALHPDEATDAIVDMSVRHKISLVIVPCCVFGRLFPHRRRQGQQQMVSTYEDLLDYLQAKHPSIQRATLPFVGANTVLYSTFSEG